jgi:serpin B
MKKLTSFLLAVVMCAALTQCSSSPTPSQPGPNPNPTPSRTPAEFTATENSLLESANKFGINLFREIAHSTAGTENIFISPLSVSYALGLCYDGADGDTREAIGATLQMSDLSLTEMNEAYRAVTEVLTGTDPLVTFQTANSFWSRQGKAIQPEFIDLAKTYFDARVEEIDFQQPWAADTINAWVANATNDKITKMIEPPISPDIAAILMNAIYFKGDWMFQFDTDKTREMPFYLDDGGETRCDMMYLAEEDHSYQVDSLNIRSDSNTTAYQNEHLLAVSLPYGRGDFRMTIIGTNRLQHPEYTIDSIIARFNHESWNEWLSGFHPAGFAVGVPKFKFEYETGLSDVLKALGMEIAFDRKRADFGNLFVDGDGWIDKVKQKAFVQVDEEGTEAAAVTMVSFMETTSVPERLYYNRPFLIVIHEDVSGAILFIGKIANPVWEE